MIYLSFFCLFCSFSLWLFHYVWCGAFLQYERVEDVEGGLACMIVIEVPVSIHSTVLIFILKLYNICTYLLALWACTDLRKQSTHFYSHPKPLYPSMPLSYH